MSGTEFNLVFDLNKFQKKKKKDWKPFNRVTDGLTEADRDIWQRHILAGN